MQGNRNQKRRTALGWSLHAAGLAVTAAILAASVLLVFVPSHRTRIRLDEQLAATSDFLNTAGDVKSRNEELTRQLSERESHLDQLMSRLPESPNESDFLAELTGLAQQTHLTIRDYRPGAPKEEKNYNYVEIALSGNATYESLCRFLKGLQSLSRVSRVTKLDISNPDQSADEYAINMSLRIYFAPLSSASSTVRS